MPIDQPIYDLIIGPADSNFTNLQDAAANLTSNSSMYIKCDNYSDLPPVFFPQSNVDIYVEPGTTVAAALAFQGSHVCLTVGAGFSNSAIISLGDDCSLICQNGCSFQRISLDNNTFVDGGGWGTIVNNLIQTDGTDGFIMNLSSNTKPAGINIPGINLFAGSDRTQILNVLFPDCDEHPILMDSGGANSLIYGCMVIASDRSIKIQQPNVRVIGNYVKQSAGRGISFDLGGSGVADGSIAFGNVVKGHTVDGIEITASVSNVLVAGNRVSDLGTGNGIADASTSSTVAGNNEANF